MRYYIVLVYNETKFIKEDEKIIDDKTLKVYLSFLGKKMHVKMYLHAKAKSRMTERSIIVYVCVCVCVQYSRTELCDSLANVTRSSKMLNSSPLSV